MLQSVLTLEQKYFYQYAGTLHCQYDDWVCNANRQPNPPTTANTIKINNYRVDMETRNFGQEYGDYYCAENTCGGVVDYVDDNGCTHWKKVTSNDIYQCYKTSWYNTGAGAIWGDNCICTYGKTEHRPTDNEWVEEINGEYVPLLHYWVSQSNTRYSAVWENDRGNDQVGNLCKHNNLNLDCKGGERDTCWALYQKSGTETCGGQTRDTISFSEECWFRYNVYRDNELIKTSEFNTDRNVETFDDIVMIFGNDRRWQSQDCRYVQNQYIFKIPDNALDFDIEIPSQQVFEGTNINVKIKVNNLWLHDIKGELKIDFRVPTVIGYAEKTEIKIVDLPVGETVFEYSVPTTQITDKLFVKPEITLLLEGNKFSGLNGLCYGHEDRYVGNIAQCEYVKLGKIIDDEHTVHISPRPLYVEKLSEGCQSLNGYIDSPIDETICIREDISQLSCMQRGCPTMEIGGEQVNFICTTSGYCAQTIYKRGCESDLDCAGLDAKCLEGASGEKFCVHEKIVEKIIEIPQIIEITKSCKDFDFCQEGYTCIDKEIGGEMVAHCVQDYIAPLVIPVTPSEPSSNKWIYVLIGFGLVAYFFL